MAGSLWVAFCDNDGVTHALAKGGGHNDECKLLIGKVMLRWADLNCDMHVARVDSAADIADGPTRELFDGIRAWQATFVSSLLPDWLDDVWHVS